MKRSWTPPLYLFAVSFGLWLLWSGHYTPLITTFGVLSTLLVVWLCHKMKLVDEDMLPLHLFWRTLRYLPWLTWQVVLSSLDVTRRVIAPKMHIDPQVVRVRASHRTEIGRVTYANSITLTPGTLTVDLRGDILTVHALSGDGVEDLRDGEMDRRVRLVEGPVEGLD